MIDFDKWWEVQRKNEVVPFSRRNIANGIRINTYVLPLNGVNTGALVPIIAARSASGGSVLRLNLLAK
ncbi:hypothetical protein P5G51_001330 [Virgibacillus sp. 179-BFC.A HS]|uniref:Uncharacterized protein n=1 Tax=Tigheibacillus jepli TaxID=3035914 RepID=A0ABU5CE05_9BACI|nr:hypothetical protein [Virgibacillus sp. 179-BFC.A HS]MDY0404231.1 hypothetical protein [Virgibacillus sp. 179-BFC.A HS]